MVYFFQRYFSLQFLPPIKKYPFYPMKTSSKSEKPTIPQNKKRKPDTTKKEPELKYKRIDNPLRTKSSFHSNMKFQSVLPEVPLEPKLYPYPFDPLRFILYKTTSLEKNHKHQLLTENNLGIPIDLINPQTLEIPQGQVEIDPKDLPLLFDETPETLKSKKKGRSKESWLRQTNREEFKPKYGNVENKKQTKQEEEETLESQIEQIEKTFEDAKERNIQHSTNPKLTLESSIPLYPNSDLWENLYSLVLFDSEPTNKKESMEHSILSQMKQKKFVSYLLPKNFKDSELEEYEFIREYDMSISHSEKKGETERSFFVLFDQENAYYNHISAKIQMNKAKSKMIEEDDDVKLQGSNTEPPKKILVQKRRLTHEEERDRIKKLKELE